MLILRWLKFKPTFNLSKNNCRNLSAKYKLKYLQNHIFVIWRCILRLQKLYAE